MYEGVAQFGQTMAVLLEIAGTVRAYLAANTLFAASGVRMIKVNRQFLPREVLRLNVLNVKKGTDLLCRKP